MQQTPPTKEDLKNMGLDFLEIAKAQLKADHNILPVIKLGDAIDGAPETVIAIVGPAMNDGPAKTESLVCDDFNGLADLVVNRRTSALRALGNGVHSLQAAAAFMELVRRLSLDKK